VRLVVLVNLLNLLDLVTTLYAIYFMGYTELNRFAEEMIRNNVVLYATYKLLAVVFLSLVYVFTKNREEPILLGVNRGCSIGLTLMCLVLGSAVVLNVSQMLFGADVSPLLAVVSKILR